MDLRCRLARSTLALVAILAAWACAATGAMAATGGAAPPSAGGTPAGAGSTTTSGAPRPATGATAPVGRTGGISPGAVRPPSAPVKHSKPKRRRHRRHHHPATAPAPTPAPAPAPTPEPAPSTTPDPAGASDIPTAYLQAYRAAAKSAGVDWRILAAIGKNESDHGRSTAPGVASGRNFADCCSGPMQLCTVKSCGNVWQFYAVDGDGDGVASVYDPQDSIYAAAALVRDLQAIVGNDPKLILAAYNAGPGNVTHYRGVPPFPETQAYVRAGLAYMALLS